MTPAGWVEIASGLMTIVSAMTCGWLGITAYQAGRRWIGSAILATPLLFSLGLPFVLAVLPIGQSDQASLLRANLQLSGLFVTPAVTLIALLLSKRYLPH